MKDPFPSKLSDMLNQTQTPPPSDRPAGAYGLEAGCDKEQEIRPINQLEHLHKKRERLEQELRVINRAIYLLQNDETLAQAVEIVLAAKRC